MKLTKKNLQNIREHRSPQWLYKCNLMQICLATWLLSKQFDAVTTSTNEMSTGDFWYHDLTKKKQSIAKLSNSDQLRVARPKMSRGCRRYIHLPTSVRYCVLDCPAEAIKITQNKDVPVFCQPWLINSPPVHASLALGLLWAEDLQPSTSSSCFELSLEWLGTSWNILEHAIWAKAKVRVHVMFLKKWWVSGVRCPV